MIIELVIQSVMMCIDHVDYKFKFFIQIKSFWDVFRCFEKEFPLFLVL